VSLGRGLYTPAGILDSGFWLLDSGFFFLNSELSSALRAEGPRPVR
jgi:hypothetical protein